MASQSMTLYLFRVESYIRIKNSITKIRFNTTQIFASNFSLFTFLLFLVLVPQSILKIQKIVRGFIGRRQYAVFLESRLVELIDIPASIRIQRYVRGYIGTVLYIFIF